MNDGFLFCRVGEGRACWSLGNAYISLGNHDQALHFARKHLEISQEVRWAGADKGELDLPVGRKTFIMLIRHMDGVFPSRESFHHVWCLVFYVLSLGIADLGWKNLLIMGDLCAAS